MLEKTGKSLDKVYFYCIEIAPSFTAYFLVPFAFTAPAIPSHFSPRKEGRVRRRKPARPLSRSLRTGCWEEACQRQRARRLFGEWGGGLLGGGHLLEFLGLLGILTGWGAAASEPDGFLSSLLLGGWGGMVVKGHTKAQAKPLKSSPVFR